MFRIRLSSALVVLALTISSVGCSDGSSSSVSKELPGKAGKEMLKSGGTDTGAIAPPPPPPPPPPK